MKSFKKGQKVVRIADYGPLVSKILKNDICVIEKTYHIDVLGQNILAVKVIKSSEPARIGIVDTINSKFFKPCKQKIIKRKPNGTKF